MTTRVKQGKAFLITEALRGAGGILKNSNKEAFMEGYDQRKELAPRDVVARAIDDQVYHSYMLFLSQIILLTIMKQKNGKVKISYYPNFFLF